jgi:hypothetical protein
MFFFSISAAVLTATWGRVPAKNLIDHNTKALVFPVQLHTQTTWCHVSTAAVSSVEPHEEQQISESQETQTFGTKTSKNHPPLN